MKLQVQDGGPSKMLELAERMVEKGLSIKQKQQQQGAEVAPSQEELGFYLTLLEDQGKTEAALGALRAMADRKGAGGTIVDEESVKDQNIVTITPRDRSVDARGETPGSRSGQ